MTCKRGCRACVTCWPCLRGWRAKNLLKMHIIAAVFWDNLFACHSATKYGCYELFAINDKCRK